MDSVGSWRYRDVPGVESLDYSKTGRTTHVRSASVDGGDGGFGVATANPKNIRPSASIINGFFIGGILCAVAQGKPNTRIGTMTVAFRCAFGF